MVSTLQASLIALVTTVASVAVGFGVFGSTTEQVVISVAGTAIGAVFAIVNEIKGNSLAKAGRASEVK